jgi:RHS repeat-associated protein
VNYTYDSLNRLVNAAATDGAFSQSYTYDGFGNLTSKSAAGFYPAYSATFNPANNQQNGVAYDANGNQTQQGTYDVSNRLVTSSNGQSYNYDYRGKRIVKWTGGTAELYFYGIDGKKLTTLQCDSNLNCSSPAYNVSFAGRLVQSKGHTVATDRLGSVRWTAGPVGYVYFPYGEERTISPNDTEKFGTYTRDSSGQDYADQRYYGVGTGRFWSADSAPASLANPGSLNKYTYANGDPVNFNDPRGLDPICGPDGTWMGEGCYMDGGGGGCVFSGVDEDGQLVYDCDEVGGGGNGSPYTFSTTVTSATATATTPPDPDPEPTDPTTVDPPEPPAPPSTPPPSSTTQPTTTQASCTLEVEDRPLNYFVLRHLRIAVHGFLDFTGQTGVSQIIEGLHTGNLLGATANGAPETGEDDGSITGPSVCAALSILQTDVSQIQGAGIRYHALGPNSTSALGYMLQSLSYLNLINGGSWYIIPQMMLLTGYNVRLPGL